MLYIDQHNVIMCGNIEITLSETLLFQWFRIRISERAKWWSYLEHVGENFKYQWNPYFIITLLSTIRVKIFHRWNECSKYVIKQNTI